MPGREPSALIRFVRRIAVSDGPETADGQLLRRFIQSRDADAFTALVERHGPMVYGVCRRMLGDVHEAEDCFQATFLILARRARAVGRPELVGGWLHGVACRVAARARHMLARRRAVERLVVDAPDRERTPELIWSDLRPVLDEEVDRLPQRYRLPFVLCYLDGLTNEEAAQLLGCPTGTIVSRLATARERLRGRLTRRGITLPAAALAVLVTEHAMAAVPATLMQATTSGLAATLGPNVAILVEGVLLTMRIHRFARLFCVCLAAVLLMGGTGALLRSPLFAQTEGDKTNVPARLADAGEKKAKGAGAKAEGPMQAVQPEFVLEAYEDNDARADELFTGKRVRVIGRLNRIKRVAAGPGAKGPAVYRLTMGVEEVWPVPGGLGAPRGSTGSGGLPTPGPLGPGRGRGKMGGKMPGVPVGAQDLLTFDFPLTAAKQLAPLRPGQMVTVEGLCEGPGTAKEGIEGVIRFRDAKLIQIHKEEEKAPIPAP